MDFFEINRIIDELATDSAPCATTWFKVSEIKKPSQEEYRDKVVYFMKLMEGAISSAYPQNPNGDSLMKHLKNGMEQQISLVLSGKNKEVEKRYKYDVDHS